MSELGRLLAGGCVRAHFQPIVDLATGAVVGYEALARGPEASPLAMPDRLFAAARDEGRLAELDGACARAAIAAAGDAQLHDPAALFVNVEPECFDGPPQVPSNGLKVIVEITERGLTARPAELLVAVERVRARGWGVAVDDVGADWRSLALLPFIRPDVVKLDRRIVAEAPSPEIARIVRSARNHVARHGGLLLAEGIEELEDERRAIAWGARLGQGWRYGRPVRLSRSIATRMQPGVGLIRAHEPITGSTPFQVARSQGLRPATARKAELLAMSVDIEHEAAAITDPAVILATFQDAFRFTPATRERYARLADGAAFVAAFGAGLEPHPAAGVRGAGLVEGERLHGEWTVIVVGPGSAIGLIARDLGDTGPDLDRRFEYVLTDDRDLILRAARSLMLRVAAEPPQRPAFRADVTVESGRDAGDRARADVLEHRAPGVAA